MHGDRDAVEVATEVVRRGVARQFEDGMQSRNDAGQACSGQVLGNRGTQLVAASAVASPASSHVPVELADSMKRARTSCSMALTLASSQKRASRKAPSSDGGTASQAMRRPGAKVLLAVPA